jgi:hypothetical protein
VSDRALRDYAELNHIYLDPQKISSLDDDWLSPEQIVAIYRLAGQQFSHGWQLARTLAAESPQWTKKDDKTIHKLYNRELDRKLDYVFRTFAGFADGR